VPAAAAAGLHAGGVEFRRQRAEDVWLCACSAFTTNAVAAAWALSWSGTRCFAGIGTETKVSILHLGLEMLHCSNHVSDNGRSGRTLSNLETAS
jgi:hypothetical protein